MLDAVERPAAALRPHDVLGERRARGDSVKDGIPVFRDVGAAVDALARSLGVSEEQPPRARPEAARARPSRSRHGLLRVARAARGKRHPVRGGAARHELGRGAGSCRRDRLSGGPESARAAPQVRRRRGRASGSRTRRRCAPPATTLTARLAPAGALGRGDGAAARRPRADRRRAPRPALRARPDGRGRRPLRRDHRGTWPWPWRRPRRRRRRSFCAALRVAPLLAGARGRVRARRRGGRPGRRSAFARRGRASRRSPRSRSTRYSCCRTAASALDARIVKGERRCSLRARSRAGSRS